MKGHVTCTTCHGSTNGEEDDDDQCIRCGLADYHRSRAVEGWLRSIRFSCKHYDYHCPVFLPWRQMDTHEAACGHAPVFCPVQRCDFYGGPPDTLEHHLTARHYGWGLAGVRYGQPFRVSVHPSACSTPRRWGA